MALPTVQLDPAALQIRFVPEAPRKTEVYRRYYGNGVDMAAIEAAIRSASVGLMADLTDLEQECIAIDPHLSGVAGKRFGSLMLAPIRVQASCPPGADKAVAEEIAAAVRFQFESIPFLGERCYDFGWANFHGRAAQEIHYQRVAGGFGSHGRFRWPWAINSLSWIHPRNLSLGPRRELRYIDPLTERSYFENTTGFALDDVPGKFLSWTPRLFSEYAEREGLGPRSLYWSFFKRFSWRYRMLLTEIFGVPWRIVRSDLKTDYQPGADAIAAAHKAAEALGGETTASFAPGIGLDVVQPNGREVTFFELTSDAVDKQLSKLWLGQPGTMDATPQGLGSGQSDMFRDEQAAIRARDAIAAGERFRYHIARPFIAANLGDEAAMLYTPKITINVSTSDRKADLEALKLYVDMGGAVTADEARERAGVSKAEPGEELLVPPQPAAPTAPVPEVNGSGLAERQAAFMADIKAAKEAGFAVDQAYVNALAAKYGVDAPALASTASGGEIYQYDIELGVVTLNEARAFKGLPPTAWGEERLQPQSADPLAPPMSPFGVRIAPHGLRFGGW